jgi:hypothetical protein
MYGERRLRARMLAHPRLSIGRYRDINFDFAEKRTGGVEDLNAAIAAVGNIDVAGVIGGA